MTEYVIGKRVVEGPLIGETVELPDDAIPIEAEVMPGTLRDGGNLKLLYLEPTDNGGLSEDGD